MFFRDFTFSLRLFILFFVSCATTGDSSLLKLSGARGYQIPVRLEIGFTDGTRVTLSSLKKPTIVFLFSTYDELSQLTLRSFESFAKKQSKAHIIGIALQPEAQAVLRYWVDAFHPPFQVGYDMYDSVLSGNSDLGPIDAVPMTVFINEKGLIQKHHFGYISEKQLSALSDQLF